MQYAATIHDAARRLEDAAAVFRLKSRNALEEYAEWGASWSDSRARQFTRRHLDPQRDLIDQGARLCHVHAGLVQEARSSADEAEREIESFFAAQSAFESAAESARHSAGAARDQATRATVDCSRVTAELQAINGAIAAAAVDPGW